MIVGIWKHVEDCVLVIRNKVRLVNHSIPVVAMLRVGMGPKQWVHQELDILVASCEHYLKNLPSIGTSSGHEDNEEPTHQNQLAVLLSLPMMMNQVDPTRILPLDKVQLVAHSLSENGIGI